MYILISRYTPSTATCKAFMYVLVLTPISSVSLGKAEIPVAGCLSSDSPSSGVRHFIPREASLRG